MIKIITYTLSLFLLSQSLFGQNVSEKLLAKFDEMKNVSVYDFKYDKQTSSYCIIMRRDDGTKSNILNGDKTSPDLIYAIPEQIRFFKDGKYAAIAEAPFTDTSSRSFLIIDGVAIQSADYMDWTSMFINKSGELVFTMMEDEKYYLCKSNSNGDIRKSDAYDMLRACYKLDPMMMEEGDEIIGDDQYTVDDKGERYYIARIGGKAFVISGEKITPTPYSDIDNTSLTIDRNGNLSYIAKEKGGLYESGRGFFVIHNGKKLKTFDYVYAPLYFDKNNSVYYIAGDSTGDYEYRFYVVKDNNRVSVNSDEDRSLHENDIRYLHVDLDGDLSYFGFGSLQTSGMDEESEYVSTGHYYMNGKRYSLGYNTREIVFGKDGEFLYACQTSQGSKNYDLFHFKDGMSKKVNKEICEDIHGYGFTPSGESFYCKIMYDKAPGSYKSATDLILNGKKYGSYDYLSYQYLMDTIYMIAFDSKENFAYSVSRSLDSNEYINEVYVNGSKLPVPSLATPNSDRLYNVYNLFYSKNDKLFYSAVTKENSYANETSIEIFVDNVTLGKIYDTMGVVEYDEDTNSAIFLASKGNEMYEVTVRF